MSIIGNADRKGYGMEYRSEMIEFLMGIEGFRNINENFNVSYDDILDVIIALKENNII